MNSRRTVAIVILGVIWLASQVSLATAAGEPDRQAVSATWSLKAYGFITSFCGPNGAYYTYVGGNTGNETSPDPTLTGRLLIRNLTVTVTATGVGSGSGSIELRTGPGGQILFKGTMTLLFQGLDPPTMEGAARGLIVADRYTNGAPDGRVLIADWEQQRWILGNYGGTLSGGFGQGASVPDLSVSSNQVNC